jgi:tetratricopeptide (TPR) repeat protein
LFELAGSDPKRRGDFLNPLDIRARLADESEKNPITREDVLCYALRAHIRVLSRAIAGFHEAPPADLVDALVAAVKSGALKDAEENRIPAFAPRHESNGFAPIDRTIAADLGGALDALDDSRRDSLLNAILETNEPLVLAQLAAYAPRQLLARIKARAEAILPADAGETRALTEAQARIEALLSAGFVQAATRFMENEEELTTLGRVPGRALIRFRSKLRLLFLQHDWSGIASTTTPEELAEPDKTAAAETLWHFRALAALHDPKGDHDGAEQLLAGLQNRRPDIAIYAINLFAARINLFLAGNLFAELSGADLVRGRQVLLEAEDMMRRARAVTPEDSAIFDSNKAILLLALREPQQAIELLTRLRSIRLNDAIAAYSAVALARAGHPVEAIAAVDQAEAELGESEVLAAARDHIQAKRPFAAIPNTTFEDSPLPRIKRALWELSRMDHVQQAEVFGAPPDAFLSFVLDQVRFAAASLTSLVPMLGTNRAPREDDLNSAIRELLGARLHFLNWTVPDQSLGGHTAAGNPGERDLVLKRDSAELAVIEAVICEQSITYENLKLHFKKLFAYGQCRLFFHLTYAYLESRTLKLMQSLQLIAQKEAPQPFVYRDIRMISSADSRPAGFIARYAVEGDEAKVVFLILTWAKMPKGKPQRRSGPAAARRARSPGGAQIRRSIVRARQTPPRPNSLSCEGPKGGALRACARSGVGSGRRRHSAHASRSPRCAHHVFGHLVADSALDPKPQRRAAHDLERRVVHLVDEDGPCDESVGLKTAGLEVSPRSARIVTAGR